MIETAKSIMEKTESLRDDIFGFLKDIISIKSTSTNEKDVVNRIKQEMEKLGYDEIVIDSMGNILGRVGDGNRIIAYDGHVDTVDAGAYENWNFDPFKGWEDKDFIYGRGSSDQKGGFAAILYGAAIAKELRLLEGITLWVTGTVQEEDCDGLCWQHIFKQDIIKPEFVLLSEPTSLNIYRGQRGRMEIEVRTYGKSAHGSAPERGENAIYKMAPIIEELEALNDNLGFDEFLGKGSLTVSEIFYSSPSRCAVADGCSVSIDRRLTLGETMITALEEINSLKSVKDAEAKVSMYKYDAKSYKGLSQEVDCYFPTWLLDEESIYCKALKKAWENTFDSDAEIGKWTFSTNGVAIMGMNDIPCVGFGPGKEEEAHASNEKILKEEIIKAVRIYALVPKVYVGGNL
jgi:putative selenium metabolism hydrolase